MRTIIAIIILSMAQLSCAHGLITKESRYDFDKTIEKLEMAISKRNLKIFTKIDHKAGADSVELKLRPTTLLIFGNPKAGTLLMQDNQLVGLDLPLKMVVTKDAHSKVSVTYLDPEEIEDRYDLENSEKVIDNIKKALAAITDTVKE